MHSFDVIIIGRGITGLSAAWHLSKSGIKNICVIAPDATTETCASLVSSYLSVTLHDNITRAAHGQGHDAAKSMLAVNRAGFSGLTTLARSADVPLSVGRVIRIADSEAEANEMAKAVTWLSSNGFPASLTSQGQITTQIDGATSASVDAVALLSLLEKESGATVINDSVVSVETTANGGVSAHLRRGPLIRGEMLITACHRSIKNLIPSLASTLVTHADQTMEFRIHADDIPLNRGDLLFHAYSNFWMSRSYNGNLIAGGARFLRKWAGIEADSAPVLDNITLAVKSKIESLLSVSLSDPISQHGVVDLRACDEIPIIGPMFGESRILLAAGYMGTGLTFGFAAGQGLSEFIMSGKSKLIPEIFYPSRLRSLADAD